MNQNAPTPDPESTDEPQIFTSTDVSVNGQNYSGLDQLPPELQEKVKTALSKMQNNPNLLNMLSAMGGLSKSALQNGIGVSHMNSADHEQLKKILAQHLSGQETPLPDNSTGNSSISSPSIPNSASASFENQLRPVTRNMPMPSSTFNPMVKGDGLRKAIFLIAIALAVGYLIIKFGYNGKLPF